MTFKCKCGYKVKQVHTEPKHCAAYKARAIYKIAYREGLKDFRADDKIDLKMELERIHV